MVSVTEWEKSLNRRDQILGKILKKDLVFLQFIALGQQPLRLSLSGLGSVV